MRKSRKFISMQVISLEDGQQIGHVRGLVINPVTKTVSALQVDQKKWFKEQKIIPFTKIRSIGDDAITIEKNSNVQKPANLPEMVSLLKEKIELIGAKVIAENGITLGYVDDYYIETSSGEIVNLEISGNMLDNLFKGKAHLSMEHIRTVGKKVLVAAEGAENYLEPLDGGLQETLRSLRDTSAQILESTWEKTMDLSKTISKKLDKEDVVPSKEVSINSKSLEGENVDLNNNDEINFEVISDPAKSTSAIDDEALNSDVLENEDSIIVSAEEELITTSNQLNVESEYSPSENPTKS